MLLTSKRLVGGNKKNSNFLNVGGCGHVAKEPERDMLSRWSHIDGMQAQKAKEKEEDCDLKEKLDSEFSLLAQSNALQSFLCPEKINALKSLLAKGSTSGGGIDVSSLKTGDKSNEEKVKI